MSDSTEPRFLANARLRVERQRQEIRRLLSEGKDTALAERLLQTYLEIVRLSNSK